MRFAPLIPKAGNSLEESGGSHACVWIQNACRRKGARFVNFQSCYSVLADHPTLYCQKYFS